MMRKGEAKRQEMLAAAEKLFLSKGYEATSVQDILDVLHASKGGFYHHFASKGDVLKLLCSQRAARALAYTEQQLAALQDDMARIDAVLHGFMPLRREEAPFMRMLLPMIGQSEGRAMGMIYQDALSEQFIPLLAREITAAAQKGTVFPPVRGMEAVVLQLVNHCWMEAARLMAEAGRDGRQQETAALLSTLERYRRAVEVLLDAPYGSVTIISIQEWDEVRCAMQGI